MPIIRGSAIKLEMLNFILKRAINPTIHTVPNAKGMIA